MNGHRIRMLFIANETFPTSRVDVDVLFGRELLGRGHQIDFVMQARNMDAGGDAPGDIEAWRGRSTWIGPTDTGASFLHRLRRHWLGLVHDLRSLARLNSSEYDVVQVRDKFLIASVGIVVAKLRRVPFFYWLSFPKPEAQVLRARQGAARYPLLTKLRGWCSGCLLYHWILPYSDHVFAQSELMKRNLCARGIDPAKVTPVPMGIDLADLARTKRTPVRSTAPGVKLAYLGVLAADRHLDVLVDTLSELRTLGMNASLMLVGDGNDPRERRILEERAELLGVRQHLEITGFLARAAALELAGSADIGLSPYFPSAVHLVASPTKLVEYMALGVPVVANHHPEQRSVLRESRAGVCAPWGARYFARAVRWLMQRSPEERMAMGRRGREWVERHRTYSRIADDVEQVYLEALTRHVRDPRPQRGLS